VGVLHMKEAPLKLYPPRAFLVDLSRPL
jgi:hypothetical protein